MKMDKSRIPICQSDLLQDVTIELGRHLKGIRYRCRSDGLEFEVSRDKDTDHEAISIVNWGRSVCLPEALSKA
jgi:hypothetical protein